MGRDIERISPFRFNTDRCVTNPVPIPAGEELDKQAAAAMAGCHSNMPVRFRDNVCLPIHVPASDVPTPAGEELDKRAAAAMGRDIERIMRDQAAREAARSDQKAVWRALALASAGEGGCSCMLFHNGIQMFQLPALCTLGTLRPEGRLARLRPRQHRSKLSFAAANTCRFRFMVSMLGKYASFACAVLWSRVGFRYFRNNAGVLRVQNSAARQNGSRQMQMQKHTLVIARNRRCSASEVSGVLGM